jgi:hypothetical protein
VNDLALKIAFEIYLLAGAAYSFLVPKERHLANLRNQRPGWSEDFVRQFFAVTRVFWVGLTIVFTYALTEYCKKVTR